MPRMRLVVLLLLGLVLAGCKTAEGPDVQMMVDAVPISHTYEPGDGIWITLLVPKSNEAQTVSVKPKIVDKTLNQQISKGAIFAGTFMEEIEVPAGTRLVGHKYMLKDNLSTIDSNLMRVTMELNPSHAGISSVTFAVSNEKK